MQRVRETAGPMQGSTNFSCKGLKSKHFLALGEIQSVMTTQLCNCNTKAAECNMQMNESDYVPIELYLRKQGAGPYLTHRP